MTAFWYQVCPKCDGQGRLVIKKNIEYGNLFLCCDECMSCWNSREELFSNQNVFYEFNIKSNIRNATDSEIKEYGWEFEVSKHFK